MLPVEQPVMRTVFLALEAISDVEKVILLEMSNVEIERGLDVKVYNVEFSEGYRGIKRVTDEEGIRQVGVVMRVMSKTMGNAPREVRVPMGSNSLLL